MGGRTCFVEPVWDLTPTAAASESESGACSLRAQGLSCPSGAQSSPCLSQLGSTHGNCERLSVLQGEAPPRRL